MKTDWRRVTKRSPCPVCKSDHWCLVSADAAICMRVPSDRKKVFRDGQEGYLHRMGNAPARLPPKEAPAPVINVHRLLEEWNQIAWGHPTVSDLARDLGVSDTSLYQLNCCWAWPHRAYAFAMRDGYGNLVGIRLRNSEGRKWAVKGSHSGLFIPCSHSDSVAYILEGPTDTAACLTMGCWGFGRPSCSGGLPDSVALIKRLRIKKAVIICDNDDPGVTGAEMLSRYLKIPHVLLTLPAKDMRAYLNAGGNKQTLEALAQQLVWRVPKG